MADKDAFDLDEFNQQMHRNQEMDKWRMMQEQTEALNKISGRKSEELSGKQWAILFGVTIPVGLFLYWLYLQIL